MSDDERFVENTLEVAISHLKMVEEETREHRQSLEAELRTIRQKKALLEELTGL